MRIICNRYAAHTLRSITSNISSHSYYTTNTAICQSPFDALVRSRSKLRLLRSGAGLWLPLSGGIVLPDPPQTRGYGAARCLRPGNASAIMPVYAVRTFVPARLMRMPDSPPRAAHASVHPARAAPASAPRPLPPRHSPPPRRISFTTAPRFSAPGARGQNSHGIFIRRAREVLRYRNYFNIAALYYTLVLLCRQVFACRRTSPAKANGIFCSSP